MRNNHVQLHDDDLVLYCAATPEAVRAVMTQAYHFAMKRTMPADQVEQVDEETGEIREQRLRIIVARDEDPLTVKQRGFLHAAVLPQIAEQVTIEGQTLDRKVWKEYYRERLLGERWEWRLIPGEKTATGRPRKRRVKVRNSTEDLGVRKYSEYIDAVIADATTELGVEFVFDQQEREGVRWKPRRKAKPQKETTE